MARDVLLEEYRNAVKATIAKRKTIERMRGGSSIKAEKVDDALEDFEEVRTSAFALLPLLTLVCRRGGQKSRFRTDYRPFRSSCSRRCEHTRSISTRTSLPPCSITLARRSCSSDNSCKSLRPSNPSWRRSSHLSRESTTTSPPPRHPRHPRLRRQRRHSVARPPRWAAMTLLADQSTPSRSPSRCPSVKRLMYVVAARRVPSLR